jgi:hypothetical protein
MWNKLLAFVYGSSSRACTSFFPTLLDEFTIHGPNGDHHCLVTEVLGPSLRRLNDRDAETDMIPAGVASKIAVQMAEAVTKLQERGVAHGGKF